MSDERRREALEEVVARLQMRYGPRAVHRVGEAEEPAGRVPHVSTSFPALDEALTIGGLPVGRISEITGQPTSGKGTLAALLLAEAQREPEALVAWLDLSRTCDPAYLQRRGLDLDRLLVVRSPGADLITIMLHLVESNTLAALVFDGLADLEPGTEPALAGALERMAAGIASTGTVALFLSEPAAQFRTLAHVAAVRLGIARQHWIRDGEDIRGYESTVHILKNRYGPSGAAVPISLTFPFDETA